MKKLSRQSSEGVWLSLEDSFFLIKIGKDGKRNVKINIVPEVASQMYDEVTYFAGKVQKEFHSRGGGDSEEVKENSEEKIKQYIG